MADTRKKNVKTKITLSFKFESNFKFCALLNATYNGSDYISLKNIMKLLKESSLKQI